MSAPTLGTDRVETDSEEGLRGGGVMRRTRSPGLNTVWSSTEVGTGLGHFEALWFCEPDSMDLFLCGFKTACVLI